MKTLVKEVAWFVTFSLVVCAVTIGLLVLGAWLDASAIGTDVIIKPEKIVTCEPTSKGWSKCNTTWI